MDYVSSVDNRVRSSMSGRATIRLLDLDITEPVDINQSNNNGVRSLERQEDR